MGVPEGSVILRGVCVGRVVACTTGSAFGGGETGTKVGWQAALKPSMINVKTLLKIFLIRVFGLTIIAIPA